MGCVLSSANGDERLGKCKERKRIIKQLLGYREEFSDSLLAYLKALRNAGATLRQFTESDTLEFEIASNGVADPPSPPTHLLPPPLPPFLADETALQIAQEEIQENDNNYVPTLETDPSVNSHWLFQPAVQVESVEEENWEETKTEFEDEDPDSEAGGSVGKSRSVKQPSIGPIDDNSSALSIYRKETTTLPMVVGRKGKTLEGIVKELDDYFLKASACIKEIAVLIDISGADTLLRQNSRRHNSKATYSLSFSIAEIPL